MFVCQRQVVIINTKGALRHAKRFSVRPRFEFPATFQIARFVMTVLVDFAMLLM